MVNIKAKISNGKYFKKYPWIRAYSNAKQRCLNSRIPQYKDYGKKGILFLMKKDDFKYLWFRDKAYEMVKPSIDRVNSHGNYELNNCRFIELKDNSMIGTLKRIRKVRQMSIDGKVLNVFDSITKATLNFNVKRNPGNIGHCLNGRSKTAFGFKWEYEKGSSK